MDRIALHWLDTQPQTAAGVTWGVSWPRGALKPGDAVHLERSDGTPLPTQHWPLAYWPDGSLKWLGCAALLGPAEGKGLALAPGPGPSPAPPVTVVQPGIEVIRVVDTGVIRVEVGDRGRYLIQEIVRDGRSAVGGVELACFIEQRRRDGRNEVREREPFAGIIEQLTVEQAGPVRAVLKLAGKYRGEQSGRRLLPFVARLIFYAGGDTVELVHSFVFDGDAERDFIAGLGVRAHVLLHDGVHNRHVRIVGEQGHGVWCDPVRMLPYAGHGATAGQLAQSRGESVPAPADGGLLPVWNDVQLLQDSCDHAVLRKRQGAEYCWVTAEHARRAPGLLSLSEPAGGLAAGLRDFWQAYPAALEVTAGGGTEAHLCAWWWAPDAEPMDLRHYGGRDHRPVYEARNPDPAVYSNAYGVARTSQLALWVLPAGSTPEQLRARCEQVTRPALLAADPAHYQACGVFSPWSVVDRSSPARQVVEDELERYLDFYLLQQEQQRWYGFWHYGDFMHSYDPQRHCWHYDQGGRAWDNTELAADLWPWYNFLRSGRADWFRFAEALTRHVGEVDVFHLGVWTAQGSRHNVVHWGCPCKEPRASQAGAKRFLHYFTADERCRDLLDELLQADRFKATNVPAEDRYVARVGPTWAAWMANWLCAWERTGDGQWRDKILRGVEGILQAPFRLLSAGYQFDYDPATGAMRYRDDQGHVNVRLSAIMGGAETWMEFAGLVAHAGFHEALAEYGAAHAVHPARAEQELPAGLREQLALRWGHARLMAWAAGRRRNRELARRAWYVLFRGEDDPHEHHRWYWPIEFRDAPPRFSSEVRREADLGTNHAAMASLNLIACLALAGDELEEVWRGLHKDGRDGEKRSTGRH
jgi:hypothetical protein